MDAKAEKIALFRYGLIAPLILETLPRGELTRRAEEIAARTYDIPFPNATPSPSTPCSTGRCAIAAVVLPPWRRKPDGTGGSRAPSPHSWPS